MRSVVREGRPILSLKKLRTKLCTVLRGSFQLVLSPCKCILGGPNQPWVILGGHDLCLQAWQFQVCWVSQLGRNFCDELPLKMRHSQLGLSFGQTALGPMNREFGYNSVPLGMTELSH